MGYVGFDTLFLGSPKWPIQMTINQIPKGYALGFFDYVKDDPIGDPIPNFKRLLAVKNEDGTPKYPAYRVQMQYAKNHALISEERLKSRLPKYEAIAKANPSVKIYISHTCEYDSSDGTAIKKRVALIERLAPSCIPVNNMWRGVTPGDTLKETHDLSVGRKGKYLVSTDGVGAAQVNMPRFHKIFEDTQIRFLWAGRFNFRDNEVPVPNPSDRTAIPTKELFQATLRLAEGINDVAPKPTFSGRIVPIKEPLLFKCWCEDFHNGDARGLKPLFICPSTASLLSIVTYKGEEVCKMKRYGNFPPNLRRYYTGSVNKLWGYQIAEKAEKMSDSEWVWIKDGNTYYGPINPAFRWGYFRESDRQ